MGLSRSCKEQFIVFGIYFIYAGHEHCNSASVLYKGVRLQNHQKSSTYDRVNYIKADATIEGSYFDIGTPIIGGTAIPIKEDENFKTGKILLYEE